jgi:hypothetical protein
MQASPLRPGTCCAWPCRFWRQTEGLLRSLTTLLGLAIGVPDHTTFSRRSPGLALDSALARAQRTGPVHVVIDATGLKVYGAYDGEPVYRAVAARQPDPPAAVIIPPRAPPPCRARLPMPRPRNATSIFG